MCRPPKTFETGNTKEATMRMSARLSVREERGCSIRMKEEDKGARLHNHHHHHHLLLLLLFLLLLLSNPQGCRRPVAPSASGNLPSCLVAAPTGAPPSHLGSVFTFFCARAYSPIRSSLPLRKVPVHTNEVFRFLPLLVVLSLTVTRNAAPPRRCSCPSHAATSHRRAPPP